MLTAMLLPLVGLTQTAIPTPKSHFGFDMGADYCLANYRSMADYWKKLDEASDRVKVVEIGKTAEGRPQLMAIITSAENHRRLKTIQADNRKLALAKELTDEQARHLSGAAKPVIWIDGGLHASETLCAQALIEMSYRLASGNDGEIRRVVHDNVILLVHANPDGHDLVADWYMRKEHPESRSLAGVPRLYQKYIGHDNNRDFFASTQAETRNMNRAMYREWFPAIVYNHHQTGPAGCVMFAPPFRDPFNYHCDPLTQVGLDMVSAAMHNRFVVENKPGVTMRDGAAYSAWWNGGLRTTAYYHNMIGILTETIGSPNPSQIPFVANRLLPKGNLPFPIEPRDWHMRDSVEYSITANMAILDYASRYRSPLLYNFYRAGKNAIEKGSRDTWTPSPSRVRAAQAFADLRKPENRDPRGYVIPADQPDFPTAAKFVQALLDTGVEVLQAPSEFEVAGKKYPANSFIVRCDQAFRPHILSMFEPQDHPVDLQYPGGPPVAPYDSAGWTLAYTMGIQFDRILEGFDAPANALGETVSPPKPTIPDRVEPFFGYSFSRAANNSFALVQYLERMRLRVLYDHDRFILPAPATDVESARWKAWNLVKERAEQLGVSMQPLTEAALGDELTIGRVALWDTYGGSMPSGWTRWIFETFSIPHKLVFAPEIDRGDLANYDVLVLVSGATLSDRERPSSGLADDPTVPQEWRNRMGSMTTEKTLPRIKEFIEKGGTVVTIGSANALAGRLGLPVRDLLVATTDGQDRRLPRSEFFIPGSVVRLSVEKHALTAGMSAEIDTMFEDDNTAFSIAPDAPVTVLARYADKPLRSGWAIGQDKIAGQVAAYEAKVGKGRVIGYGPEVLFRAQTHGTFKLVFNALIRQPG
ncbi:MAG: hypothetical protein HONBIEJF_02661 [Fimbriimonadaceae bacterium]|nr:hypothetical protein [Fimbriimonadaceae bacterium]